jgi:hypothetical protein
MPTASPCSGELGARLWLQCTKSEQCSDSYFGRRRASERSVFGETRQLSVRLLHCFQTPLECHTFSIDIRPSGSRPRLDARMAFASPPAALTNAPLAFEVSSWTRLVFGNDFRWATALIWVDHHTGVLHWALRRHLPANSLTKGRCLRGYLRVHFSPS